MGIKSAFPRQSLLTQVSSSGIYEDEWASEDVLVTLAAPDGPSALHIEGQIPALGDDPPLAITVSLDGQRVAVEQFHPGNFTINVRLPDQAGRRRIEIRSSRAWRLTAPDTRQASFLIRGIVFDRAAVSDKIRPIRPVN
jgi:hypothetical protein